MSQEVEPMDVDSSVCDFDDKENAFHHNNVPRTPCTEKGYEELDVSELNMKLRYSITPAVSPMSKSYTANCIDNRNHETDITLEPENGNMTRSLHTTLTKNDTIIKTVKTLPLQALATEHTQIGDGSRNVLQPLDSTITTGTNVTVSITSTNEIDENISLPSSSSSLVHTPEATTPTKDIPKTEGGSPIIRGLKSVLNMFRPSQSPIPGEDETGKLDTLSPPIVHSPETSTEALSVSTPLMAHTTKEPLSKKSSLNNENKVFNADLEKELEWSDDSTILFSNEKIPIHKLLFQQKSLDARRILNLTKQVDNASANNTTMPMNNQEKLGKEDMNETVEYMDISYNDSGILDKTETKLSQDKSKNEIGNLESDGEFVDCESTFTKNDTFTSQNNTLNSTEDVLSHINDIVEAKSLDGSQQTLNGSEQNSVNLSTASTATTLPGKSTAIEDRNMKLLQDTLAKVVADFEKPEDLESPEALSVSDNTLDKKPTHKINEVSDTTKAPDSVIESNVIVNSPVIETVGVNSIAQIPLIVDPRVLLFNIPVVEENENKRDEDLSTSPADIPLPEDDDMPSLPVMNSELETLSHTLDKIAEEIPKINQHELMSGALPDDSNYILNNLTVENVGLSENVHVEVTEEPQIVLSCIEKPDNEKTENIDSEFEEALQITNSGSIMSLPSSNKLKIEADTITKNDDNSTYIPNRQTEFQSIITKDCNININHDEINVSSLPPVILNNPISASDVQSEIDKSKSSAIEKIPNEIEKQTVELMDLSMADDQDVCNNIQSQVASEKNILDFKEDASDCLNENIDLNVINNIKETFVYQENANEEKKQVKMEIIPEKSQTYMDNSNVSIIKEEIEAIIDKAIAVVMEKTSGQKCKLNHEKIIENNIIDTTTLINDTEESIKDATTEIPHVEEKEIQKSQSDDKNEALLTPSEGETLAQQTSLNKMSDNKYSYTVQDNIEFEMVPSDIIKSDHFDSNNEDDKIIKITTNNLLEETLVVESPNSETIIEELDKTSSDIDKIEPIINDDTILSENVQSKPKQPNDILITPPSVKANDVIDITPSDTEKNEVCHKIDEELTVSENNSPFVLVPNEFQDTLEKINAENVDGLEDPFATKVKIVKTPPSSPKIVSKGYNFNFDEMDDPFATKTKIRLSPGTDVPHTFGPTLDEDQPKVDFTKSNRRKSQPEKRKRPVNNKKLNSTFAGKYTGNAETTSETKIELPCEKFDKLEQPEEDGKRNDLQKETTNNKELPGKTQDIPNTACSEDLTADTKFHSTVCDKETSSLEESTYFSAGASSEVIQSQTEIKACVTTSATPMVEKEENNPFATRSKICVTPPLTDNGTPFAPRSRICETPPELEDENPFATKSKIRNSSETSTARNISVNIDQREDINTNKNESFINSSSIDKDCTTREVNTEDEDTVEGPFLDADLLNDDKTSDTDVENDMIQFTDIPQVTHENQDNGELFIDAEAFEFLLNQNKANTVIDSGKESLFLKFDPLFAKRVSTDGMAAALKHIQAQIKQSTPKKEKGLLIPRDATFDKSSPLERPVPRNATFDTSSNPLLSRDATFDTSSHPTIPRDATFDKSSNPPILRDTTFDKSSNPPIPRDSTFDKSSLPGPSGSNITQEEFNSTTEESFDDLNITVSKPMMVVNPAVNPIVTPRNKTMTPVRSNRQSLTFASPAIAVIDRLLSMSAGNSSLLAHDTTVTEIHRDREADQALSQLRELLADKEINVYSLRSETKELQNRLANLESQIKSLEAISEERLKKINDLNTKLNEKTEINKSMAKVVEEYERTIASLITEAEQDKKRHAEERLQLIRERDEQTAHLTSMEVSFSDLHSKYEKSKQVILGFKANEETYKKSIKEFEENLSKMQNNYEMLKQHATAKLNHANEELQKINRAHEAEVLKMNALIKRKDLHITSLEETLQQKTKANEELTAICDELINKVG